MRFLAVLYLFFLCIELMGDSFKLMGKAIAKRRWIAPVYVLVLFFALPLLPIAVT